MAVRDGVADSRDEFEFIAGRNDASVVDHDRRIGNRGRAGTVNQSAAHDG